MFARCAYLDRFKYNPASQAVFKLQNRSEPDKGGWSPNLIAIRSQTLKEEFGQYWAKQTIGLNANMQKVTYYPLHFLLNAGNVNLKATV